MILFGPTILKKNGILQGCVCVCARMSPRAAVVDEVQGKVEKENRREFETERGKEKGGREGLSSAFCH